MEKRSARTFDQYIYPNYPCQHPCPNVKCLGRVFELQSFCISYFNFVYLTYKAPYKKSLTVAPLVILSVCLFVCMLSTLTFTITFEL